MQEDVIAVSGLAKRYDDLRAVDGIDFLVKKGEVFSILGPNGAGKSTTIEISECFRTPSDGSVKILWT